MKSFKGAPVVGLTCLLLGCGGRTIGSTLGGAALGDGGAENPVEAGSPIEGEWARERLGKLAGRLRAGRRKRAAA